MKRILLILAIGILALQCIPSQSLARERYKGDKWYVGALYGLNSKTTHNDFMTHCNGSFGVRLGYEQTSVFGYMGEVTLFTGDMGFGASKCIIKALNADLMAVVNLAPIFYKSSVRRSLFEPRLFAGFGVNHIFGYPSGLGNNNDLISKLGLDLGFNVGRKQPVYLFLQPAINYNLDHYSRTQYNINYSALQIAAGIHYRFSLFQRKDKDKSQEKDPAEAVTIITTPAITPSTPVREETPVTVSVTTAKEERTEVTPVTPAKEDRPEVTPVTPAKEEKGKETAETTVAEDTPKAVHQKPVIHDVSSSSTKSKNSATAKKSAEAKTPVTTQGTTASKASEATKTPDSSVPATAPKTSTATKSPDSAVPATTQKSSTTAKAPATSKSTATKKNAEASKAAATKKNAETSKAASTKKTSGVEKKQEETPQPKATPQTKPAQNETGSQPTTTSTPLSVRQKQGGLTEVATFLKTHPKTTVTIRGDKYQAEEARNQLVRRYNISLNRITIQPDSNVAKLTFEVEM